MQYLTWKNVYFGAAVASALFLLESLLPLQLI